MSLETYKRKIYISYNMNRNLNNTVNNNKIDDSEEIIDRKY